MTEAAAGTTDETYPTAEEAVAALVRVLDIEEIDQDLYRGAASPNERGRAFGGQVAAQALTAATRSVAPEFLVHSMHSYFLLPGDPSNPIVYDVERLRDGRSFLTRRVVARQHGRPIYFLTANFQLVEEGYEHQDAMPPAPEPESLPDFFAVLRETAPDAASLTKEWAAVEVRAIGNSLMGLDSPPERPAQQRMWVRIASTLPDDHNVHVAAFTWASDISLLGASLAPHTLDHSHLQMASLDHSIWFHRPFRADRWWLYDQESPSAQNARGLSLGRVFTQDGVLVATAAQEGLIRPRKPQPPA